MELPSVSYTLYVTVRDIDIGYNCIKNTFIISRSYNRSFNYKTKCSKIRNWPWQAPMSDDAAIVTIYSYLFIIKNYWYLGEKHI